MTGLEPTTTRARTLRRAGVPAAMAASARGVWRRVDPPEGGPILNAPPFTIDADRVELGCQPLFGGRTEAVLTGLTRWRGAAELAARGVLA
jgi:hypothetical protein